MTKFVAERYKLLICSYKSLIVEKRITPNGYRN